MVNVALKSIDKLGIVHRRLEAWAEHHQYMVRVSTTQEGEVYHQTIVENYLQLAQMIEEVIEVVIEENGL